MSMPSLQDLWGFAQDLGIDVSKDSLKYLIGAGAAWPLRAGTRWCEKLDRDRTVTIWFDSWLHQYDDSPAVALLQTLVQ